MNINNLVKMANQIGQYFETQSDREAALNDIAHHLSHFWDPRMRQQLMLHIEQSTDNGLSDILKEALLKHKII